MKMHVRSLDWSGQVKVEWSGDVIRDDHEEIVLRCQFTRDVQTSYTHFRTDDVTVEHYPRRQWFNAFKLISATGALKGFYCNVAQPPIVEGDVLSYTDLTLDLFVFPDGRLLPLDEEDFERRASGEYPAWVAERAREAMRQLMQLARQRQWIFSDLATVGGSGGAPG